MIDSHTATSTPRASRGDVPFAYEIIARVAPRLGIALELEPFGLEAARLEFSNGRIAYFRHGNLDINGSGTADIARDKHACAYFLAAAGIAVPPSYPVRRTSASRLLPPERLIAFATEHSWPLVVKPNSLYGGRGVEKVDNMSALLQALKRALRMDKLVLVQPFIRGQDLRVVVLDGSPIAAYSRIAPTLVGDGERSVKLLIESYYIDHGAAELTIRRPDRREVTARLAMRSGGLLRVPRDGEHVPLVDAANVATGADVVDLTRTISPDVLALAVNATKAAGLRLAGVDLLADLDTEHLGLPHVAPHVQTRAIDEGKPSDHCVVLEINSAPETRRLRQPRRQPNRAS